MSYLNSAVRETKGSGWLPSLKAFARYGRDPSNTYICPVDSIVAAASAYNLLLSSKRPKGSSFRCLTIKDASPVFSGIGSRVCVLGNEHFGPSPACLTSCRCCGCEDIQQPACFLSSHPPPRPTIEVAVQQFQHCWFLVRVFFGSAYRFRNDNRHDQNSQLEIWYRHLPVSR